MMNSLSQPAPAKINLTLRVLGRRPDGFHQLESLVARLELADTLTVGLRGDGRLTLACDHPDAPRDQANLVLQGAERLRAALGTPLPGADIVLHKRIPVGSGLGGGSSNAATALSLLNQLWQAGLSDEQLARLGAKVGSDVPLFFHTPLCIVRGRGERVTDTRRRLDAWVALVIPPIRCSTPKVYAAWDRLPTPPPRPAPAEVLEHLANADEMMKRCFNDLEPAAFAVCPDLGQLARRLTELASGPVRLTGSGSAFFRCYDDPQPAAAFVSRVRQELGLRAELTRAAR